MECPELQVQVIQTPEVSPFVQVINELTLENFDVVAEVEQPPTVQ